MNSLAIFILSVFGAPPSLGLSLPPGFEVSLVAGDELVHDAFVMTVHPKGHVLVGGRGYLKVLVDADGDGKAESAKTIDARPDLFPMGLWWTEKEFLFVSDKGLWSLPMEGLTPKGPATLVEAVKAKGEHEAHAVKRGPDGWLYVMCGNMAGIDESWATDVNSPVKKPVAGCLVRISPDGRRRQVVADGFRNAYDFDWNAAGDPFTFDSDNERCVSLPWYEGCRLYHVVAGANHGWLAPQQGEFWRKPPYFFDVAEPLADVGRGSPTGVVCYRGTSFPARYQGGLFFCDWTFGKIYFATLTPSGASYDAKVEVFAKPVGDEGFAPVSAAVDPPTGDLLVAIGGRGTRGAVYRVRYSGRAEPTRPSDSKDKGVVDQFVEGFLPKARRSIERKFLDSQPVGLGGPFAFWRPPLSIPCIPSAPRPTTQREWDELAWQSGSRSFRRIVRRIEPGSEFSQSPETIGNERDRQYLLESWDAATSAFFDSGTTKRGTVFEGYARRVARITAQELTSRRQYPLFPNYTTLLPIDGRNPGNVRLLREMKRSASLAFDLSAERRMAFWSDLRIEGSIEEWSARWVDELATEQSVIELVHTLICLARCPLPVGAAGKIAAALLSLDEKLEKAKAATDRNWPLRIGELHEALAERVPELNAEMVKHPSFGRPAHALFAGGKSFAKLRPQAAARLFEFVKAKPDAEVTADVVKLLAVLPSEQVRPTMEALWERRGLRDELTNFFTINARPEDAVRLVESLSSPRVETVERALLGLEKLTRTTVNFPNAGNAVPDLLAAAERSATLPKTNIPQRATEIARKIAGIPGGDRGAVVAWLKAKNPGAYAKLQRGGVDWPGFEKRMASTPWVEGDVERGKAFYQRTGCNACHAGSGLGPDLKGVASRFSREDLFRSIVDPSKDVSDRYRTTQVLTKAGAVRIGLLIYESADGLLLQTAPAEMVRIPETEIEEKRLTRTSLMPVGLLKDASDRDLADLYAYLKALK